MIQSQSRQYCRRKIVYSKSLMYILAESESIALFFFFSIQSFSMTSFGSNIFPACCHSQQWAILLTQWSAWPHVIWITKVEIILHWWIIGLWVRAVLHWNVQLPIFTMEERGFVILHPNSWMKKWYPTCTPKIVRWKNDILLLRFEVWAEVMLRPNCPAILMGAV